MLCSVLYATQRRVPARRLCVIKRGIAKVALPLALGEDCGVRAGQSRLVYIQLYEATSEGEQ